MIDKYKVLVLNADYSIIHIAPLKRIIHLCLSNKVNIVKYDNGYLHPSIKITGIPKVVSLKRYINIPFKVASINRKKIFQRDDYKCQYCNKQLNTKTATIDHIIPKSRNNSPGNTWSNLVTCCKDCNNYKSDKTPEEIGMRLIKNPFVPKQKVNYYNIDSSLEEMFDYEYYKS